MPEQGTAHTYKFEDLLHSLQNEYLSAFRKEFLELHPYDQASFFKELEKETKERVFSYLSPNEMAYLFENLEMNDWEYQELLATLIPSYVAEMLADMSADDAVDILNALEKDQAISYLAIMEKEAADNVKALMDYEEDTAGSIMTLEYISIPTDQTVASSMNILKREAPDAETIYYIYAVDKNKRLAGVVSLRSLIVSDDHVLIADIMQERVFSVGVSEDQENVARKMRDYDFLALPVVDFQQRLLGIITVDDILDVLEEEASEDYSKFAAVSNMDFIDQHPFSAAKKRLPWLIILLFLGMFTASLIGRFEETLNQVAILAVFIPLIGGMAGNTGTQALAVAVRGLATGDLEKENKWKLIAREAGTGIITGLVCGVLVAIIVFIWQQDIYLGMLVGISILGTLIVATIAGAIIPIVMNKFNIDPAVASGPFITTINDIISIFIYFGMATMFMSYLTR
ncbi:magnesium transporter [Niallia sp. NCCP-28]|uniref:magnesium transporter n=1 Tax=Niallia sp. NCCP-28 TaxID=2934712 RepID=UPI002080A6A4|nr:magnesium transporter [Niallia sp. NCCP-28]GKU81815.1 magnesium transporter MgtE [Niallia sp. NCCP-28]